MAGQFTAEERAEFRKQFDVFDDDKSGSITMDELAMVMKKLGEKVTTYELKKMIEEVDADNNGTVEFEEFVAMIAQIRSGKGAGGFGAAYNKAVKLNIIESSTGGSHSYSDEEKQSFIEYMNQVLKDDPDLATILPVNPEGLDIFAKVNNGLLLSKLINWAVPDTIDLRALNRKPKLSIFEITENNNLVVNSAKSIGCNVINIGAQDLMSGKEHLVLGLIWQIIKIGLLQGIELKNHPYLVRLLEPGEELSDLLKLSPEEILLRWFNYHLREANHPRRVKNFSGDIKDSENYTVLLSQISKGKCDRSPMGASDLTERADRMLSQADKIDCRKFLQPRDVVSGNGKLNLAFVANLFNTCPGLEPVDASQIEGLSDLYDDEGDLREERAFRMWMNSLNVDPEVRSLFEDLRNGLILLQVLDKIKPGIVDWKKVNKEFKGPSGRFKKLENCNYVIELSKTLKFSLVGIAGDDIAAGNRKLTLAVVWQMMRFYILNFIKNLSKGGKAVTEEDIIHWANSSVQAAGKSTRIESFKDPSISSSVFLIDLLAVFQPNSVDYSNVHTGDLNDDQRRDNAKFAITTARKLGCSIFCLWEDIVEVKPKMILTFLGAVMAVYGMK